jgi:transposase-like protein
MSQHNQEQYWQGILQQQAESGLTKSAFCRQHKITVSAFYAWAKKLSVKSPSKQVKQKVIPLMLPEAKPEQLLTLTLPNGYQLSFSASLEPSKLQQILSVMTA